MKDRQTAVFNNKKEIIPVLVLLGISLFLHVYRISEVPRGIYIDEMAMAYDWWSLGHFGVERHLTSWPIYLNNCGGGQSTLYGFLDMPLLMIMGFSPVAIRIPSIVFSMIAGICGYRIIKRQIGYRAGLIYLGIFTLVPYFTMAGRIGLDCNLMLGLSVLMMDLMQRAVLEKKRLFWWLAGLTGGITFYAYVLSHMILPVFIVLLVIYLLWIRKIGFRDIAALFIPMILLGTPLLIFQIINLFDLPEFQIGPITFTRLIDYRSGELSLGHVKESLHELYICIFKNDISKFSNFKGYSNLYPISVPFLAAGAVMAVMKTVRNLIKREFSMTTVIVLFAGSVTFIALMLEGLLTYRINMIFFSLAYMIVLSLDGILSFKKKWSYAAVALIFAGYLGYFISFTNYYFNVYPDDIYPQRLFGENPVPVIEYVRSMDEEIASRRIYLGGINEAYLYYLAYTETSPYDYDLENNGNIGTDDLIFYAPQPYDINANYIYYLPREEVQEGFEEMGFECTKQGPFYIYIHE